MKFEPIHLPEWLKQPTPNPQWLIEGFVPAEGLIALSGPRKRAGKTWMAMLLASIGSTGAAFQGLRPTRRFKTLFIEEEGTTGGNKKRWQMLANGTGFDPRYLDQIHWAFRPRIKLDKGGYVPQVVKYVREHQIDLVVLDAITYMHTGDENSKRDMQAVVSALMSLRAAPTSIMWLMHTGKGSQRVEEDIDLAVRGSSVMMDVYDSHLALRRSKIDNDLILTCRHREAEETNWSVEWDIDDRTPSARPTLTSTNPDAKIANYVKMLTQDEWLPGEYHNTQQFAAAVGLPLAQASELRNLMVDKGLLVKGAGGRGVALRD